MNIVKCLLHCAQLQLLQLLLIYISKKKDKQKFE